MAETFEVAHFQEQGQQIIVVFVNASFGNRSNTDQESLYVEIQSCASNAGLVGSVVLVWQSFGQMKFYGPNLWAPFFKTAGIWNVLVANRNKKLTCG